MQPLIPEGPDDRAKLRKYYRNLIYDGWGTIIFAVWGIFKLILGFVFDIYHTQLEDLGITETEDLIAALIEVLILAVIVFAYFMLCFSVSRGAIRFGNGTSSKRGFLVGAAVIFLLTVVGLPGYFNPENFGDDWDTALASFLIDLTLSFILIDMFYSFIRIKRLEKNGAQE